MNFSNEQQSAIREFGDWYKYRRFDQQVFRLFGAAGTGKSSIAKHLASLMNGKVFFAAYTGKAAEVLRQKGCTDATTLHSLMYTPKESDQSKLIHLQEELDDLIRKGKSEESVDVKRLKSLIKYELYKNGGPNFKLNKDSDLRKASLIVIDEISMIDRKLGEDLVEFNVPILALGDPFQLPPVKGTGYFTDVPPDFMLTEVHRQALDSPVLRLATEVRNFTSIHQDLRAGKYGDSYVYNEIPDIEEIKNYSQHIVGLNKTRRTYNNRFRELLGYTHEMPQKGDRLVCLRNNHDLGILNGSQWIVKKNLGDTETCVDLHIHKIEDPKVEMVVGCHKHFFRGEDRFLAKWDKLEAEDFDYGYFMTTHKAQGSQWDSVMIFDQSYVFKRDARKWLYTAITRACNRVAIIRSPKF